MRRNGCSCHPPFAVHIELLFTIHAMFAIGFSSYSLLVVSLYRGYRVLYHRESFSVSVQRVILSISISLYSMLASCISRFSTLCKKRSEDRTEYRPSNFGFNCLVTLKKEMKTLIKNVITLWKRGNLQEDSSPKMSIRQCLVDRFLFKLAE